MQAFEDIFNSCIAGIKFIHLTRFLCHVIALSDQKQFSDQYINQIKSFQALICRQTRYKKYLKSVKLLNDKKVFNAFHKCVKVFCHRFDVTQKYKNFDI